MIRRIVFIFLAISLAGCTSTGFKSYNCMQLEGEPLWRQVALDRDTENRLKGLVESYYSRAPKDAFLMNKDSKRKYFWFQAESGDVLACIVNKNIWRRYHEGCFADRIIINIHNGSETLKEADSVVCT